MLSHSRITCYVLLVAFLPALCQASPVQSSFQAKGKNNTMSLKDNFRQIAKYEANAALSKQDTDEYNCLNREERGYLDYSGECKSCLDLCRHGDLTTCVQKCPTTYEELYITDNINERIGEQADAQNFYNNAFIIGGAILSAVVLALLVAVCYLYKTKKVDKQSKDLEKGKGETVPSVVSSQSSLATETSKSPLLKEATNSKQDDDNISFPEQDTNPPERSGAKKFPPNDFPPADVRDEETTVKA